MSLVTPNSVIDYDLGARTWELRKQQEVRGGYDPSRYHTERAFAEAPDGTRIPLSLVYRTPLVRDGARKDVACGVEKVEGKIKAEGAVHQAKAEERAGGKAGAGDDQFALTEAWNQ